MGVVVICARSFFGALDEHTISSVPSRAKLSASAVAVGLAAGGASDAAAVRGDAGPDRAATDTDGIGGLWSSRQRNPSINWLG